MKSTAAIKPTMGLRVVTHELKPQLITFDEDFQKCPIAHAIGVPLYMKRLFKEPRIESNFYRIVKMMSEPSLGVAVMDWQYGGILEPAPQVLVVRSDGIAFSEDDYCYLEDFEDTMLDEGPRKVTRKNFLNFIDVRCVQSNCNIIMEALYPKGSKCRVVGLINNKELNGKIGTFNGMYENERVGVKMSQLNRSYAVRPQNVEKL